MPAFRVAVIGLGKIARDQHLPSIAADPDLTLAATVDPQASAIGETPHFASLEALLQRDLAIDAVAICTPPQVRRRVASEALAAGLHVLLEKPPGASLAEIAELERQAAASGVTLFASWHSRYAAGVEPARLWLANRKVRRVDVVWREDVRHWHPGQTWIWTPGGLGVFDPAINALSIITCVLPRSMFVTSAELFFPENCDAPIAATAQLTDSAGGVGTLDLNFLQTGTQTWDIRVETDDGVCRLSQGGAVLSLPGGDAVAADDEYPKLYRRFVELLRDRRSDVDIAPMRLVADAFLLGRRHVVEAFIE